MRKSLVFFTVVSSITLSACSEAQVRETMSSVGQEISDTAARVTASAVAQQIKDKAVELGRAAGDVSVIEMIKSVRSDVSLEYLDANGDGIDDDGKITVVVGSGQACIDFAAGVTSGRCL